MLEVGSPDGGAIRCAADPATLRNADALYDDCDGFAL